MPSAARRAGGARWLVGYGGPRVHDDFLRLLDRYQPRALILFRDNLPGGPPDLAPLRARLEEAAQGPLTLFLDEEGGWIQQLLPAPLPAPRAQALSGPEVVERCHAALGHALAASGVEVAITPLADLDDGATNPVIGSRSFGAEPALAGACVAAALRGLSATGVLGVIKHFPGHGDSLEDSHLALPAVSADRRRAFRPFADGIAAGAPAVMSAHLRLTGDEDARPATYRPRVMRDWLRGELGFAGLAITDALEMAGAAVLPLDERGEAALAAGNDLLTLARWEPGAEGMIEGLAVALDRGRVRQSLLDEGDARWQAFLAARGPGLAAPPAAPEVDAIAAAAVFRPGGGENPPLGRLAALDVEVGALGSWREDEYLAGLDGLALRRVGEYDALSAPAYLHLGRTGPGAARREELAALARRGDAPLVLGNGAWDWLTPFPLRLATAESSPAGLAALLAAAGGEGG